MNRFFTLLLAASCLTAVGQTEYPYNPDFDGDGYVQISDLIGFLSFFNQPAVIQTCFKGELCLYMQGSDIELSTSGCGTIAAHTSGAIQNKYVNITNEGYSKGDVIHLVHICQTGSAGNRARFYTLVDGQWLQFAVLGDPSSGDMVARAIFNGANWELLNQD